MREAKKKDFGPLPQMISLSPDGFTHYSDTSEIRAAKRAKDGSSQTVTRILNTGRMSRGALKKLSNAGCYLYLIAPSKTVHNEKFNSNYISKVTFLTLTLASEQMHDDKWVKNNMLKHFIDACRRKYPAISYVWKAEPQKNGNLHFHVMSDHFFCMSHINKLWYHIQWEAGYMQKFFEKHMEEFEDVANEKKISPPGVKVETAKDKESLGRYFRKYMKKEQFTHEKVQQYKAKLDRLYFDAFFSKNWKLAQGIIKEIRKVEKKIEASRARLIEGKLWGCSDNLLTKQFISNNEGWIDSNTIDELVGCHNSVCVFSDEYTSTYRIDNFADFLQRLGPYARDEIRKHFHGGMTIDDETGEKKYKGIWKRDSQGNVVTAPKDILYSTNEKFDYKYEFN